jgi:hypothetical protein
MFSDRFHASNIPNVLKTARMSTSQILEMRLNKSLKVQHLKLIKTTLLKKGAQNLKKCY